MFSNSRNFSEPPSVGCSMNPLKAFNLINKRHMDSKEDDYLSPDEGVSVTPPLVHIDRYRACMVLAAVGDAVGYRHGQWEFLTDGVKLHRQFDALTGGKGMKALKIKKMEWPCSDDTIMHMATAKALASNNSKEYDLNRICTQIAIEYKKCWKDMGGRAPGGTTARSVGQLSPDGTNWNTIVFNETAGGCGASMRAACIGLRFWKPEDEDQLVAISIESGRITHHNPTAYLGSFVAAIFTAYAIRGYDCDLWGYKMMQTLNDKVKNYLRESKREVDSNITNLDFFINHWNTYLTKRQINSDIPDLTFPKTYDVEAREEFYKKISFSGWGGASGHDSVIIAYDALLGCNGEWEELCKRGVLHGGDSDSTGTIAAAWYGAIYGFKDVEKRNYNDVEFRKKCQKLGEDLHEISQPKRTWRQRFASH